jgi:tetratricopeptide (TPR) repeat protein
MDENLMNLRQRMIETSTEFIQAYSACLDAISPNSSKSQMELKETVEEYHKAAEPYEAALQELRQYLLAAEPSEAILAELERTERFIETLDKEIKVGPRLIERQIAMIARGVKLTIGGNLFQSGRFLPLST